MLENKGTGTVCFICGKVNHKAKYCPDKKLRGKYRRERINKLITTAQNSISSISLNESPSLSNQRSDKNPSEKTNKNPFETAKGNVKELYEKIIKLNYISNGLANEIYKHIESIYWLKMFNELNVNNKKIYKSDYASKIIREKINKIAFNYDKNNGLDSKEYKSFDEANKKMEMLGEEIEKQEMKAKIELIRDATKTLVKTKLCKDMKISNELVSKGKFATRVKRFLMLDDDGEWGPVSEGEFFAEINRRVLNSINNEFKNSLNDKRKELSKELIDNNLNLRKIKEKEEKEINRIKRNEEFKKRKLEQRNQEIKALSERENNFKKFIQEKEEERKKQEFKNNIISKFESYISKKKLFSKSLFSNPKLIKSFPEFYDEFKKLVLNNEERNKEDDFVDSLQGIYNSEIMMRMSNNKL